jgi:hypothetical protein
MEPISLRALVRQKLADGRLPHDGISRVSEEPSRGEVCDACNELIAENQFVMEGVSTDPNKVARCDHCLKQTVVHRLA